MNPKELPDTCQTIQETTLSRRTEAGFRGVWIGCTSTGRSRRAYVGFWFHCSPNPIPGVRPGARILLHAEGEQKTRAVLARIDAIEALGIEPAEVSPAYWRTLGNRLAAHLPLPDYSAERHAAWLAGRALQ